MNRAVILAAIIIFLTSCVPSGRIVVVDPWWEQAFDQEGELRKSLFISDLKKLKKTEIYTVETKEEALEVISRSSPETICETYIITPSIFSYIDEVQKKNKYIILNGFYGDPADNVIAVYSSREEVYFRAGVKSAEYSRENDDCKVAAVFYDGSDVRRLERDSFEKGFESVGDKSLLKLFSQQTYSAGDRLKSFINTAPDDGVGLFFFSASSINPYCLELALPLSIPVSGENLNSLGFYNELIEFSVDDDIMEIVNTALELGLDGEIKNDIPISPLLREKGIHF